jgi:hypothetical protein
MSHTVYRAIMLFMMLVFIVAHIALMAHQKGWRAGFNAHKEICEKFHR